jgi:hypothetical protein
MSDRAIGESGAWLEKPKPRILQRRAEKRKADAEKRDVYLLVDARDCKQCKVCGRKGNPYAVDPLGKLHHVHILDASLGGEMKTWNLWLGCSICHALIHAKQLWPVTRNADQSMRFEIHEAAVVEVFGRKHLPAHVRIVTDARGVR